MALCVVSVFPHLLVGGDAWRVERVVERWRCDWRVGGVLVPSGRGWASAPLRGRSLLVLAPLSNRLDTTLPAWIGGPWSMGCWRAAYGCAQSQTASLLSFQLVIHPVEPASRKGPETVATLVKSITDMWNVV